MMFVVFVLVCSYVSDICLNNLVKRAVQFQLFVLPCSIQEIHHHPIITLWLFGTDFPPVRSEWHFPNDKTDINNKNIAFSRRSVRVSHAQSASPQSRSAFSASLQTFCLTVWRAIAYVRCIKILTWLQGFLVIFLYLVRSLCRRLIWFGFLCAQVSSGNCETM